MKSYVKISQISWFCNVWTRINMSCQIQLTLSVLLFFVLVGLHSMSFAQIFCPDLQSKGVS